MVHVPSLRIALSSPHAHTGAAASVPQTVRLRQLGLILRRLFPSTTESHALAEDIATNIVPAVREDAAADVVAREDAVTMGLDPALLDELCLDVGVSVGSQPVGGEMVTSEEADPNVFKITYRFPGYGDGEWVGYLTASREGSVALRMLEIAFQRRLVFRRRDTFGIDWAIRHPLTAAAASDPATSAADLARMVNDLGALGITRELLEVLGHYHPWSIVSSDDEEILEEVARSIQAVPARDESGLLGQITGVVSQRMDTLDLFCAICDRPKAGRDLDTRCADPMCRVAIESL